MKKAKYNRKKKLYEVNLEGTIITMPEPFYAGKHGVGDYAIRWGSSKDSVISEVKVK